jgi:1,2-diacylglycerol 3-alpha-glucosyltransferase
MKILFVSDTYYPHLNGVYYFVCRIAPLLQERGHAVAVLAPSETTTFTKKRIDGIDVYGVPSLASLYPGVRLPIPLMLASRCNQVLDGFRPDVIHLQDHFLISKTVVRENKKRGIPIIATNHFMPENLTALLPVGKWFKGLEAKLWSDVAAVFNQVRLVTTPTETAARLIRPALTVPVLPMSSGIDLSVFNPFQDPATIRQKYGIPDKPILLYVGRLDPEKKLEEAISAAAIARKITDFHLVLVGRGVSKVALERQVRELGMADVTTFTGYVPDEDLPRFYTASRCFIITSTAELLSLSALQAMASRIPVIAVNAGALSELVKDGSTGFLCGSGDINRMAQCIVELMGNEERCAAMGARGLEYAAGHDLGVAAENFERLYERVLLSRISTAISGSSL